MLISSFVFWHNHSSKAHQRARLLKATLYTFNENVAVRIDLSPGRVTAATQKVFLPAARAIVTRGCQLRHGT
jgi:hypothetical protein